VFCRQQVAQLRDVVDDIRARGAELVVIGNGRVEQARQFAEEQALPFALYTDPTRESYGRAGLRRGVLSSVGLGVVRRGVAALRDGYRQGPIQGDPLQQGGVLVIATGGDVLYRYVSEEAGDHPSNEALLRAVSR
jgi:peroxiredoxin